MYEISLRLVRNYSHKKTALNLINNLINLIEH